MVSTRLYLGSDFKAIANSARITIDLIKRAEDFESTQHEVDARIILHSVYSAQYERVY